MMCNVCNKRYVGEMSMALNKRMNLHWSDWKTKQFNRFQWREPLVWKSNVGIEANNTWTDVQRKMRETY